MRYILAPLRLMAAALWILGVLMAFMLGIPYALLQDVR